MRRFGWVVLTLILVDWLTKWLAATALVPGIAWPSLSAPLRLQLVSNPALFRGMTIPGGGTLLYTVLGLAAMTSVLWAARKTPAHAWPYLLAFGLILGGGSGNVIERAVRGAATDFITVGLGVFNLADVFIASGAAIYLWFRIRDGVREEGWRRTIIASPAPGVFLPPSLR